MLLAAFCDCAGMQAEPDWVERARLSKEWSVANGADIYLKVAELFDQQGALDGRVFPEHGTLDLPWAWKKNPLADKPAFTLTWPKGTKVMDMVRDIARRRSERADLKRGGLLIIPASEPVWPPTFQQKSTGDSAVLDQVVQRPLQGSIVLEQADGQGVEEFLNYQFQRTHEHDTSYPGREKHPGAASPFLLKMSAAAKERTAVLTLRGYWSYRALFDIMSLCCGLQWHIDGNTVIFKTAEEAKSGK